MTEYLCVGGLNCQKSKDKINVKYYMSIYYF